MQRCIKKHILKWTWTAILICTLLVSEQKRLGMHGRNLYVKWE